MATDLTRAVTRETTRGVEAAKGRRLIVTLGPGDRITFREKGRRGGAVSISIEGVYVLAVDVDVRRRKREEAREKQMRRAAR